MKIGFFDTGLGGATIFKEAYNLIDANYIYMADTLNSPYGIKDSETVKKLTDSCIQKLINLDCKIIVIACNTATSVSINYLREKYPNITFIGTEPAIKLAYNNSDKSKRLLITATSLTLKETKLSNLIKSLNISSKIDLLALDKLVEYADYYENIEYSLASKYLLEQFSNLNLNDYSAIVLGCTHFPIFKNEIKNLIPNNVQIFDSAIGIANNLKNTINTLYPNYSFNEKSVELVLTKENLAFKNKFYKMINS